MGKGDARRPTVVDDATHQKRWDKAFAKPTRKLRPPATKPDMKCLRCGFRFWHHQWQRCPQCYGFNEANFAIGRRDE